MRDRRAVCGGMLVLAVCAAMALTLGIAPRTTAAQDAQQIPMSSKWGYGEIGEREHDRNGDRYGNRLDGDGAGHDERAACAAGFERFEVGYSNAAYGLKGGVDRILVRGRVPADAKVFPAAIVVAMKAEDLQAKKARDVQEWQTHGIGGS